jgi:hypothetical protein
MARTAWPLILQLATVYEVSHGSAALLSRPPDAQIGRPTGSALRVVPTVTPPSLELKAHNWPMILAHLLAALAGVSARALTIYTATFLIADSPDCSTPSIEALLPPPYEASPGPCGGGPG